MTELSGDLLSLLYASEELEPFDDDELTALLEQSRAANARREITGMLLYRKGRFVQVLEGPEEHVRALVESIRADPRHTGMRVLLEERVRERRFADWTMGYQALAESVEPAPSGFRDTFDDLDTQDDDSVTLRAARELSLWFRVRSASAQ